MRMQMDYVFASSFFHYLQSTEIARFLSIWITVKDLRDNFQSCSISKSFLA